MDVHRLCSVIDLVIAEHNRLSIDHRFGQIFQTLDACVSNPGSQSDERFRSALTSLLTALRRSRTNDLVESGRRILRRIGAERLTGDALAERVLAISNERPFLAARAREVYLKLAEELAGVLATLAAAKASMQEMHLESAQMTEDEYELGILLSNELAPGELVRIISELNDWAQLLQGFLPAISGKAPVVCLRSYSSGCFELSVGLDRDGALGMGMIITGLDELFRRVRGNREKAAELARQGYPVDMVERFKSYEQEIIQAGMKGIKEELVTRHLRPGTRRPRELDKLVERGLRTLAIKFREGASLEIVGPAVVDLTEEAAMAAEDPARTMPHHVRAALRTARARKGDEKPQSRGGREREAPTLPLSHITGETVGEAAAEATSQKAA